MKGVFGSKQITDSKRLARGEHLLLARTRLRIRDRIHHLPWNVWMLAGDCPNEEIAAIRELMHRAKIIACDIREEAIVSAVQCGADRGVCCDLSEFTYSDRRRHKELPAELKILPRPDLIDLDLCGTPTPTMRDMVMVYLAALSSSGILILTFSYGRDVSEVFLDLATTAMRVWAGHATQREIDEHNKKHGMHDREEWNIVGDLVRSHVPRSLIGRLLFLFAPSAFVSIRSIILYPGSSMPMCSVLIQKRASVANISVVKIGDGDFELAVCYPDPSKLYSCPQERIESLRKKHAAIKAAATLKAKRQAMSELSA